MENSNKLIQLSPQDNVAVAVCPVAEMEQVLVNGVAYTVKDPIPFGHKMMLHPVQCGQHILRYGHPIGHATRPISPGEWVHSHNLATNLEGIEDYQYTPDPVQPRDPEKMRETFFGYLRENGEVGTRNEVWILPTVSCVNHTTREIARRASIRYPGRCDGFLALPHNAGCSQLGEDHLRTQRLLAGIANHPNAGGVLLVGLGCENNTMESFLQVMRPSDPARVRTMIAQDVPGDEVEYALELIGQLLDTMDADRRTEVPVSKLRLGMKCGGSDAFSGITSNPLCGRIADRLAARGGSVVLTEVPEMFGAERLLMNRAKDQNVFEDVVELINDFKEYYISHGQPVYENPSPGNKKGGITTLEEKSLGCIQKGGCVTVTATLHYGEKCTEPGLNLLNGPGNDNVSITDLLASGVQAILFTTGRGNPLGTAVPTLKIASTDQIYERKRHWFDFNAGMLLDGVGFEQAEEKLWEQMLEICSGGEKAKNEISGNRCIMIFKDGVIL